MVDFQLTKSSHIQKITFLYQDFRNILVENYWFKINKVWKKETKKNLSQWQSRKLFHSMWDETPNRRNHFNDKLSSLQTYLIIQDKLSLDSLVQTRYFAGAQITVVCSASTSFVLKREAKSMDPPEAFAITIEPLSATDAPWDILGVDLTRESP